MAKTKVDNKLNVVIGTKAQITSDTSIPENSIIVVTDEELKADEIVYDIEKNVKEAIEDLEANKVDKVDNVDNLTTNDATKVLSAKQGKTLQDNKVNKTLTILGLDLQDNILIGEFRTALGNATQSVAGLLSAADKTHLDGLVALLDTSDGNNVVDTIGEILAIFNNYPEGADLVTALQGKVDKVVGKGLSENDLTDTLKSNYDTAYSWGDHAVEGYLKAITKAMVEGVLTGAITTHTHNPAQINTNASNRFVTDTQISTWNNKVDKVTGKGLSTEDYTSDEKDKLSGIETGAEVNEVNSVNTKQGDVVLNQDDVGDGATYKRVSQAEKNTWDGKQDKLVAGLNITIVGNTISASGGGGEGTQDISAADVKALYEANADTNAFTDDEKDKLGDIQAGAEVNVQSDWAQEVNTADDYIKNKPAIPTKISDLTNDSGFITTETDPIFTAWNKSTGISITKSQVSDLIVATQSLPGLMSTTDKQRLDVLHALLEEDTSNNVVDSINEVLAIFNNYPEGADLLTALAGKVDKVAGKGLSTNDLTNTLKSNYDTAYNHSQSAHAPSNAQKNSDITKAEIEAKLTGEITSHNHDGDYYKKSEIDTMIGDIDTILDSILGV